MASISQKKLEELQKKAVADGLPPEAVGELGALLEQRGHKVKTTIGDTLTGHGVQLNEFGQDFEVNANAYTQESVQDFTNRISEERGASVTPKIPTREKAGVYPQDTLKAVGTAGLNLPSSGAKFVGDIVDLVGVARKKGFGTIISGLWKDPTAVLGTGTQELVTGFRAAAKAPKGEKLQALADGAQKASAAFQADPIGSIITPKGVLDSIKAPVAAGKFAVKNVDSVKRGVTEVASEAAKAEGGVVGKVGAGIDKTYSNLKNNTTVGQVLTATNGTLRRAFGETQVGVLAQRAEQTFQDMATEMNTLVDLDEQLSTRRNLQSELDSQAQKISELEQQKFDSADTPLELRQKSLQDIKNEQTRLTEEIQLMESKRAEAELRYKEKAKSVYDAMQAGLAQNVLKLQSKTYDGKPQWTNAEDFSAGFDKAMRAQRDAGYQLFEEVFKRTDGEPIIAPLDAYIDALDRAYKGSQDVNNARAGEIILDYKSGLVIRNEYMKGYLEGGHAKGVEAVNNITDSHPAWGKISPKFKSADQLRRNTDNEFGARFYLSPIELKNLTKVHQTLRDKFKAEDLSSVQRTFDTEISDILQDTIEDVLSKQDSDVVTVDGVPAADRLKQYQLAKDTWRSYRELEKAKQKTTSMENHMRSNFPEYSKSLPPLLKEQIQDYFAVKTYEAGIDLANETFSPNQLFTALERNGYVLNETAKHDITNFARGVLESKRQMDDISREISQTKIDRAQEIETARQVREGIPELEATQQTMQSQLELEQGVLADIQETAKRVGTTDVEFVNSIKKVQSVEDLNQLVKDSGKTPEDLLKTVLAWEMKQQSQVAGNIKDGALTIDGIRGFVKTYESIASKGDRAGVMGEMTMGGSLIDESMGKVKDALRYYDEVKTKTGKTKFERAANGALGILAFAISYPLTGAFMLQKALTGDIGTTIRTGPEVIGAKPNADIGSVAGKSFTALTKSIGELFVRAIQNPYGKIDPEEDNK